MTKLFPYDVVAGAGPFGVPPGFERVVIGLSTPAEKPGHYAVVGLGLSHGLIHVLFAVDNPTTVGALGWAAETVYGAEAWNADAIAVGEPGNLIKELLHERGARCPVVQPKRMRTLRFAAEPLATMYGSRQVRHRLRFGHLCSALASVDDETRMSRRDVALVDAIVIGSHSLMNPETLHDRP